MVRRLTPVLLCVSALLYFVHLSAAKVAVTVDESHSRLAIKEDSSTVTLAIVNPTRERVSARVYVEISDPEGVIRSKGESNATLTPGSNSITAILPLNLSAILSDQSRLPWYNLRYRLEPQGSSSGFSETHGTCAVASLMPDLFDLRVTGPEKAIEGMRYRTRVRATHPLTNQPVKGVLIEGEVDPGDEDQALKRSSTTGADGFATLEFDLPRRIDSDEIDVDITGKLNGIEQNAYDSVDVERRADILVSSDKPLYQPGQTLHVRALVIDPYVRRALGERDVDFEIRDPDGTNVFTTTVRTTRFGVATFDWPIDDNTRLGDYSIVSELDDDDYEDAESHHTIKISRYELPNFIVKIKPDRTYYLPGQDAEVVVSADYVFGKPVKQGRVRVVRESDRRWSFEKQKWEVDEGDSYEGETGSDGGFVARIPLQTQHQDLSKASSEFEDHTYAAYFTDPTTNRTEQRRFDLRVTRQPIHVYAIKNGADQTEGFPLEFYLSTYYADGTPASCSVTISQEHRTPEIATLSPVFHPVSDAAILQVVKTNQFGFAKVTGLLVKASHNATQKMAQLEFTARDNKGLTGTGGNQFDLEDRTVVRVSTDRTIYRRGQSIRAEITSNRQTLPVAVEIVQDHEIVHSQVVRLEGGRAAFRIPSSLGFRGEITIGAFPLPEVYHDDDSPKAFRNVLFPVKSDLSFDVKLDQDDYKPGDEARAELQVRDADGKEIESALGVVVTDRAVDERARTDREFGGASGNGYTDSVVRKLMREVVAGFSRWDLEHLDPAKRIQPDVDLVAEIMLARDDYSDLTVFSDGFETDAHKVFAGPIEKQVTPIREALSHRYDKRDEYPQTEEDVRRFLSEAGIRMEDVRDPWGSAYRFVFRSEGAQDKLQMVSDSSDKRRDSRDDFVALEMSWPYFRKISSAIDRAVKRHHERTGRPIRDRASLHDELLIEGIDFEKLKDRWGQPYELRSWISGRTSTLTVFSAGPDRVFQSPSRYSADDVTVSTISVDYFNKLEKQINDALDRAIQVDNVFPKNDAEFRSKLKSAGVPESALIDAWGRPYEVSISERLSSPSSITLYRTQRFDNKLNRAAFNESGRQVATRLKVRDILLGSRGPDGLLATYDDFYIHQFSRVVPDDTLQGSQAPSVASVEIIAGTGALTGLIVDPQGAAIPNATVHVTNTSLAIVRTGSSNDEGVFLVENLAAGKYEVRFEATGFQITVVVDVPVEVSNVTNLDATLSPGAVTETVTVSASAAEVVSLNSAMVSQVVGLPLNSRNYLSFAMLSPGVTSGTAGRSMAATPRLREYFPETLVWQPSVETDASGRARIQFKLADNITTWKMSVIGSTLDGQLGIFEKEIRSFQPFFVDHDPPKILTEGDEISLPVVLRNYLDKPQSVQVEMKPEKWFTLLDSPRKVTEVAASDSARAIFDVRAVASIDDGKQRVTAIGSDDSDAIEKEVTVHPDGEEMSQSVTQVFSGSGAIDFNLPNDVISGSAKADLKVYPNLFSHIVEGVEGIMKRPYGCGEQTISSTYPSLLVLRHHRGNKGTAVSQRAEEYLKQGYRRLLGYQHSGGGFGYWAEGSPDFPLTIYAIRFLSDASKLIEVDPEAAERARVYLLGLQRADGAWGDATMADERVVSITAYIARVLARLDSTGPERTKQNDDARSRVKRALKFLAPHIEKSNDANVLASYALAAADSGEIETSRRIVDRLLTLRREEQGYSFWENVHLTPFYGWGLAGRIETTALVVQAMSSVCRSLPGRCAVSSSSPENSAEAKISAMINAGIYYLLRQKDRHGVWHSTQATIMVFDAIEGNPEGSQNDRIVPTTDTAEVFLNGRHIKSLSLPKPGEMSYPVRVELTGLINAPGANRVEIKRPEAGNQAAAQVSTSYYRPWRRAVNGGVQADDTKLAPTLKVSYGETEGKAGQAISCRVDIDRGKSRGWGMMLVEVGLPPGAEVDRASLEMARKEYRLLDRYDILPDRLVAYVWPSGSSSFEFKFTPRYPIRALTAPSQIYDYYNPESRAVVAPTRFVIR